MTTQLLNRTCRCCGRSIMHEEREYVDSFQEGLDVCPGCLLHFKRTSCLFGEPDLGEAINDISQRMRRELMASIWE